MLTAHKSGPVELGQISAAVNWCCTWGLRGWAASFCNVSGQGELKQLSRAQPICLGHSCFSWVLISFCVCVVGLPAVIVAVTLATSFDKYVADSRCWLNVQTNVIWAFVGPVLFILAVSAETFLQGVIPACLLLGKHRRVSGGSTSVAKVLARWPHCPRCLYGGIFVTLHTRWHNAIKSF